MFFPMCGSVTPTLQKVNSMICHLVMLGGLTQKITILKWGNYMDGKNIGLDLWAKISVLGICKIVSIIKLWVVNYINRNKSL